MSPEIGVLADLNLADHHVGGGGRHDFEQVLCRLAGDAVNGTGVAWTASANAMNLHSHDFVSRVVPPERHEQPTAATRIPPIPLVPKVLEPLVR